MKIHEMTSKLVIPEEYNKIKQYLELIMEEHGEDSKKFKKAKEITSSFFEYDDPNSAIISISQQLSKMLSHTKSFQDFRSNVIKQINK